MKKTGKQLKRTGDRGKQYREAMILCICVGIVFLAAGTAALCNRKTAPGVLLYCLSFAVLCTACVFEFKAQKFPKVVKAEDTPTEYSEEQLQAMRQGKPVYNFSNPVMKRKVNIMGSAFIGVGSLFAATGLAMFWIDRNHDTSKMMIGVFSGMIMMGAACIFAGILMLTLKKHPQRAPYLKAAVLVFCVISGIFLFVITDLAGAAVFTDILQVFIIFYAMDVVIRQGRI